MQNGIYLFNVFLKTTRPFDDVMLPRLNFLIISVN